MPDRKPPKAARNRASPLPARQYGPSHSDYQSAGLNCLPSGCLRPGHDSTLPASRSRRLAAQMVIALSVTGVAAARFRVRFGGRLPAGRWFDALLARTKAHRAGALAHEAREVRLLCRGRVRAAAQKADSVSQPFRFFEVQRLCSGSHPFVQRLDGVCHISLTHRPTF